MFVAINCNCYAKFYTAKSLQVKWFPRLYKTRQNFICKCSTCSDKIRCSFAYTCCIIDKNYSTAGFFMLIIIQSFFIYLMYILNQYYTLYIHCYKPPPTAIKYHTCHIKSRVRTTVAHNATYCVKISGDFSARHMYVAVCM